MLSRRKKYVKYILTPILGLLSVYLIARIFGLDIKEPVGGIGLIRQIVKVDYFRPNQLINLSDFKYSLKNNACLTFNKDLLGVIIVTSYFGHDVLRSAHRQAISQEKLRTMGLLRVFLLAEAPKTEKYINQKNILDENTKFQDIVQGNFIEAYRNLTYKHIMGLRWAATTCKKAKFIVKIDDDTIFDVFHLKNYLESMELQGNLHNFLAGYVIHNMKAIREPSNKWFVSTDEFKGNIYPDFLSGWLYITNVVTARKLVVESQGTTFFWIDDTYVTGMLRKNLNISLIRLNNWFSANSEFLDCCIKDLKKFSYECDLYVGPNGGDNNMIVDFLHEVEKCYFDECTKRTPEQNVNKTCVAAAKNIMKDRGDAIVNSVNLG